MAKLKKRPDGRFRSSVLFEGKKYYVYASSAKEIPMKKAEKLQELMTKKNTHDNPLLDQYYEAFTDFRRSKVRESTIRNQKKWYSKCANVKVGGIRLGDMKIRDIKPADIKCVQTALIRSDLSSSTVNDYMSHLSHVFNSAAKDETVDRNPCICIEEVSRKEPKARDTTHRALTKEETETFFKHAENSFFFNDFRLMIQTGMRVGELGALTLKDIDTKNRCIQITKTVTRDEDGTYIIGQMPKTEASNREIPLNNVIIQIISDQQKFNKDYFGPSLEPKLFRSPEGEILREYAVNREIKRICKETGIENFASHAFRATFATRFIEQRPQDYKILSEILGHASTKITLDLYTHVMKDSKKNSMENIEIAM